MQKTRKLLKNLKFLLSLAYRQDPVLLWLYFGTSFLGVLFMFAVFFGFKLLIDSLSPGYLANPLFPPLVILGSYLFFEYVSRFLYYTINQYMLSYIFRSKFNNTLVSSFISKVATLDFASLEDSTIRNLISKVEDTYSWKIPNIINSISYLINNVASIILSLLVALQFDIRYFIVLTVLSIPMYYLKIKYGTAGWDIYSAHSPLVNKLWYLRGLFRDSSVLSEIKLYGLKGHFIKQTHAIQDKLLTDYQKPIIKYSFYSVFFSLLIPVAIYFPLQQIMGNFSTGLYTIGDFTFLLNTLFNFSTQISNLLVNTGTIYEDGLFLNDYVELMGLQNKVVSKPKSHKITKPPQTIEFQNVSFTYPGSKSSSLVKINLIIKKGVNTAIVGENGAGKTTLIKLLLRFYDPTDGRILIDGVDLREIDLTSWYNNIGVLFQNFAKYYFTLKENVAFGDITKKSSSQDIEDIIKSAQGQDLLAELPNGIDQILGKRFEDGQDLSTGQWQKVAIARALYRSAPYLILDEPTSNIDAEAESKIFDNLITHYKKHTLLFISHRFSTVRHADQIVVIHKGTIQSTGTHLQLLQQDGLYKKFFNLQKRGYDE